MMTVLWLSCVFFLDIDSYLLSSMNDFKASRYGAFTFEKISADTGTYQFNTHANFTAAHAAPIFANVMANAILKSYAPTNTIKGVINPLPPTRQMVRMRAFSVIDPGD